MNRRVLLINPKTPFLADPAAMPPLGLLYLGAALEANDFEVKVVDLAREGSAIAGYDPCLIGITCLTCNYPLLPGLLKDCATVYSKVPVILGGPHFSIVPEDARKLGQYSVGIGDCETSLNVAAHHAAWHTPMLREYFSQGKIGDVNRWPIPARHLLPVKEYGFKLNGQPATGMITSRGCPYSCPYCCHWDGYRTVRYRLIENVIDEVQQLKHMGFSSIVFYDDEFNLNTMRMSHLCRALEPKKIRFRCIGRADLLDYSQAQALALAGCVNFSVGVESGSPDILRAMNKPIPKVNSRARQICHEHGIPFKAYVMVGLPGETRETVQETKRWLIENQVDELTTSIYMPYPGTDIYDHPEKYDIQFNLDYHTDVMSYYGTEDIQRRDLVRTSELSAMEIAELRDEVDRDVRRELGLPPALVENESTAWRDK